MRSKKERESDIYKFWEILDEFPKTQVSYQEPPEPDFYHEKGNTLIGIEHTSLVHERDENGVDIVMHNVLAKRITEQAWKGFTDENETLLHVTVSYKCSYGLALPGDPFYLQGNDQKELTNYLKEFVLENYPKETGASVEFDYRTDLHDKIASISIWNTEHLGGDCWSEVTGGVVPRLSYDHLNDRINSKNNKVKNYQKDYSSKWLVIVENETAHHTYFDLEYSDFKDHKYKSLFDRLFVFRLKDESIIELVIEKN